MTLKVPPIVTSGPQLMTKVVLCVIFYMDIKDRLLLVEMSRLRAGGSLFAL